MVPTTLKCLRAKRESKWKKKRKKHRKKKANETQAQKLKKEEAKKEMARKRSKLVFKELEMIPLQCFQLHIRPFPDEF